MTSRLYRTRTDKMIAGVCGGLSHYLNIDVTWVRLFFVLLGIATQGSLALMLYLALWIVMPEGNVDGGPAADPTSDFSARVQSVASEMRESLSGANGGMIVGGGLLLLGVAFLVRNLGLHWFAWFNFGQLWPLLLVLMGLVLLMRRSETD